MGLQLNLGETDLNEEGQLNNDAVGLNESELLKTIQKDQFELEKLMLKRDHEILNNCIQIDEKGKLTVLFKPITLMLQKNKAPQRSSSSDSVDSQEIVQDA